jgi:hypothetical protein
MWHVHLRTRAAIECKSDPISGGVDDWLNEEQIPSIELSGEPARWAQPLTRSSGKQCRKSLRSLPRCS